MLVHRHNMTFLALFKRATDKEALLFFAAILAVFISNSDLSELYHSILTKNISISYDKGHISMSTADWVNDLLMALFFLVVGIEIKREVVSGHLSTWKQRSLPLIAAVGGVILPSIIYIAINHDIPATIEGWAIPSATDIAVTLGALSVFGKKVPASLKVFITALAIIDDLIAIIIIAFFYNKSLEVIYLAYSFICILGLIACNKSNVRNTEVYVLLGGILWCFMLFSGVHATIAGVALGLTLPLSEENDIGGKMEQSLSDLVGYVILPLFAFVNSGVSLNGSSIDLFHPVTLGIFFGLFFGKQIGIFLSAKLAIELGIAQMPEKSDNRQLYAGAVLCGIGFTMSLFVSLLAFDPTDTDLLNQAKVGIFAGSIASLILGSTILRLIKN